MLKGQLSKRITTGAKPNMVNRWHNFVQRLLFK